MLFIHPHSLANRLLLVGCVLSCPLPNPFPSSEVCSLLFTFLGFAEEDTPVLFVGLQLFHAPTFLSPVDRHD
jgi:hypothetical protein